MNNLQVVLDEQKVAKENAEALLKAFGAPFTEAGKILKSYNDIVVTDESQTDLMAEAREKRLALKKIRTGVENKRKELKESALRTSQAIDGVAKYIKEAIQPAEEYLELQEKFAETKAAERAAAVKAERIEALSAYSDNLSIYNFDTITEEAYQALLAELKAAHEAKLAEAKRIEDQRIAKEKADAEAAEAQRKENERLKAEAKEREQAEAKKIARINELTSLGLVWNEQSQSYIKDDFNVSRVEILSEDDDAFTKILARVEAEMQRRAKLAEEERIAKEKAEREQREKEDAEREAERKKAEKLEQEKRDREAADAKAKAEAEEAERQALLAPDKEKLLTFSTALEAIRRLKLPAVKTKQAQDVVNLIDEMLSKMQKIIATKAEEL